LLPSVRWCGQCYAPVHELSPRPPLHREGFVGDPQHDAAMSRWAKGATTFGPAGRVGITVVVALVPLAIVPTAMGIWPLALWFLLGYSMLAAMILRDVWRPVRLDDDMRPTRRSAFRERHPLLGRRVPMPARLVGGMLVVGIGAIGVQLWLGSTDLVRYLAVATTVAGLFGFVLMWWLDR